MKLPNIHLKDKKPESNYFLTLTLGRESGDGVIFEETAQRVRVVGHHKEVFDTQIEDLPMESLLETLDKVVSGAEKNLPDNIKTQKTVFGVDPAWVEAGKIKKDYLLKLKKVSEELELTPVGFIITTEAIAHLLEKEEGAPVSAVLAEVGKKYLTATLIRAGRIIESKTSELHESAPFTLDTLLKHMTSPEVLPSRIIVYGESSQDLNQEFLSYSWSKSLPFLHVPQVTPLSDSFDAKAVLFGAATQMNFTVMDTKALDSQVAGEIEDLRSGSMKKDFNMVKEENPKVPESDEEFGFLQGEDISKTPQEESKPQEQKFKAEIEEIPEELKINRAETKSLPLNAALLFTGIKSNLGKIFKFVKLPKGTSIPTLLSGRGKILAIPGVLLILLFFLIFYFLFFRTATVVLSITPKNVEKAKDVVFSTNGSTDPSNGTIKGELASVSEDGKLSSNTTGKKQTGDTAKGTVTVFNLSSSPKSLSAGTTITSSNNLNFTLDKSITVASGSGDATSPTPGKTDVSVTAEKFGTQYNIPSGTKFTVGDNQASLVAAKNDGAFSGGTTKDITVVAQADLDKLSSDVVKNLQDKAKQDIGKKISQDKVLLPDFVNTTFDLKSFDKKVGDEAEKVSITASVTFDSIAYSKDDLNNFAKSLFEQDLGRNLEVNSNETKVEVSGIKKKSANEFSSSITLKSKIIPKLDIEGLAKEIKGKSSAQASESLSKIPQVGSASVNISPSLFFLPKLLPSNPSKIHFIVNQNG